MARDSKPPQIVVRDSKTPQIVFQDQSEVIQKPQITVENLCIFGHEEEINQIKNNF